MSYESRDDRVLWKGKRLKQCDPATFRTLGDPRFARSREGVWMRGKRIDVDAASFTLLSATYAKDAQRVFEVMDSKLKAIPKADAASFRAVGDHHGADHESAFWHGKIIRKASGAKLRELDPHHACDGERLTYVAKTLDFANTLPLDLERLTLLPARASNAINLCDFILHDGTRAVFVSPRFSTRGIAWHPIDSDAVDKLRFLVDDEANWIVDEARLFWRGRVVTGLGKQRPTALSPDVLRLGKQIFVADQVADDGIDGPTLVRVSEASYADGIHLWELGTRFSRTDKTWQITQRIVGRRAPLPKPLEGHIEAFLRYAIDIVFRLREHLDYAQHWRDVFHEGGESVAPPPSRHDVLMLELRSKPSGVTLSLAKAKVEGRVSDWYRLGCELWATLENSEVRYQPFPHPKHMMSDGLYVQKQVLNERPLLALHAAEALEQLGAHDDAHGLAAQVGLHARAHDAEHELAPDADTGAWAMVSPQLLAHRSYRHRYTEITASTYLAGAKRLLASGLLEHDDFRTRYEAMALAHGLTCDTGKDSLFLREIIPAIRARVAAEDVGFVRDLGLCTIDLACRPSVYDSDWREHARPHLQFLIEQGFNTSVNRRRLEDSAGSD